MMIVTGYGKIFCGKLRHEKFESNICIIQKLYKANVYQNAFSLEASIFVKRIIVVKTN